MQFAAEAPYVLPGRAQVIRLSNPSASYQLYTNFDQVLVCGDEDDTSGYFVSRFYSDPDGLPPYESEDDGAIGAYRIIATGEAVRPVPAMSEWGIIAAVAGLGIVGLIAVRRRAGAKT